MELQWPLILFMTFIAWSAGLFAVQGIAALRGESAKTQLPALITTLVLLVIGGIAVFTHLQHWERIFNGFGHITSGITQELICIVLMIVVAVVMFAFIRKGADKMPAWVGIAAIVVAVLTAAVTGHSYMMAARPAWNSILWVLVMVGNACAFGPLTFAVLDAIVNKAEGKKSLLGMLALIGTIIGAATVVAYVFSLAGIGSSFETLNYYFDCTEPTHQMVDPLVASNLFASEHALLLWGGVVAVGAILPVICGVIMSAKPVDKVLLVWGIVGVVAVLIGAICVRALFFTLGVPVFIFY